MDEVICDKFLMLRDNICDVLFGWDIDGGCICYIGLDVGEDKVIVCIVNVDEV